MNQTSGHVVRLLCLCALAVLQFASSFAVAQGEVQTDATDRATDQLNIGRVYEAAGRLADAEMAYRRALETGTPKIRADALAALSNAVRLRADSLLSAAKSLEDQGRISDAEAAYLQILSAGTLQSRSAALNGLARLSATKDSDRATAMLKAGAVLEHARRWEDAEMLYIQVLETGTPVQRELALARIKEVAEIRGSFHEEQLTPIWGGFLKILLSVVLLFLLIVPVGWALKLVFRRRYRNCLGIGDFGNTEKERLPGAAFGETLTLMHERMSDSFRQRSIVGGAGKMPLLIGSSSSEVLDLIADVNESLVPFRRWFSKVTYQPGYQISGWTEATRWHIKVCVKLERSGEMIQQWSKTVPLRGWFASEQDLAYEILMRLKEYTDDHAA